MVNEPIKLKENLYLYSGDIITINYSDPLLIEAIMDQTIKLRSIKDNNYLKENNKFSVKKFSFRSKLKFSTDFENALTFFVKKVDNSKISLQANDKYLESNDKKFYLSSEEKWLIITKQQNTKDIVNFEETIVIIDLHKDKEKKVDAEKVLTATPECYDNKSGNTLSHTFEFTESIQKEHNFTWSNDFTLGTSVNLKLTCCSSIVEMGVGGQFEKNLVPLILSQKSNLQPSWKNLIFLARHGKEHESN